jgi:trk system potassium uptake protein TrkH
MRALRHPVRLIPLLFALAIAIGTAILMLPISNADGSGAPFLAALFTSTSAVSVTGLIVVDTQSYWSGFGQAVILLLIQIGGLGIMTAATLLGLMVGRGFGLQMRMATHVERNRLTGRNAASVLKMVLAITLFMEVVIAVVLTSRFAAAYDFTLGQSVWHGVFHSISAFNNAGFSTFTAGMMDFQSDAMILLPIMLAIIAGSLGFPVYEDWREHRFDTRRWTLHSRITLAGTGFLLLTGFLAHLAMEWSNPSTLGPMGAGDKLLNAAFHSVMPRTAGFNSLNVGDFREETLVANYILMFIGGGSAGTAGGVKVTTFFVLVAIVLAEVLGRRDAAMFGRRFGHKVERQALTVVALALFLIVGATMFITSVTALPLQDVLFETISAFATVGMSTGITAALPPSAQLVLILLMFIGRVGTITTAAALALRSGDRKYRYPEENPIVG